MPKILSIMPVVTALAAASCISSEHPKTVEDQSRPACSVSGSMGWEFERPERFLFFPSHSDSSPLHFDDVNVSIFEVWKILHSEFIGVVGHTDADEIKVAGTDLGLRRARVTATALERLGIPKDTLLLRDDRFSKPLFPTDQGANAANRYVSIIFIGNRSDRRRAETKQCAEWVKAKYCELAADQADKIACKIAINTLF